MEERKKGKTENGTREEFIKSNTIAKKPTGSSMGRNLLKAAKKKRTREREGEMKKRKMGDSQGGALLFCWGEKMGTKEETRKRGLKGKTRGRGGKRRKNVLLYLEKAKRGRDQMWRTKKKGRFAGKKTWVRGTPKVVFHLDKTLVKTAWREPSVMPPKGPKCGRKGNRGK